MFYYVLQSSHWSKPLTFKSRIPIIQNQCFRIISHDGSRNYPTRFKTIEVSYTPVYTGTVVEIFSVDFDVEKF